MTKDEIINRIDAAISEMQALKSEVQNIPEENDDNSVPNHLDFNYAEYVYYVTSTGLIGKAPIQGIAHADTAALNKRLFKSLEYAEEYKHKSQFIADLLHFKWLYDRDFVPDWNNRGQRKYYVYYNMDVGGWCVGWHNVFIHNSVVFSNEEIAQKCADWLNYRKEKINE